MCSYTHITKREESGKPKEKKSEREQILSQLLRNRNRNITVDIDRKSTNTIKRIWMLEEEGNKWVGEKERSLSLSRSHTC